MKKRMPEMSVTPGGGTKLFCELSSEHDLRAESSAGLELEISSFVSFQSGIFHGNELADFASSTRQALGAKTRQLIGYVFILLFANYRYRGHERK